ncbi:hypothetical protein BU23DRAFT_502933 [Bimuria novae-zelandiae CBS 107.79]|uniref:DUF7892 domain-containing protein n=1 Tax=Bimuria novae-zelandiae CBS 107.79 TaxID=1447943 RepID=A0A6A5VG44_9PLEO|nr:hypothetical protein BU23DRAFT_502933 [Bimuria novae-zelandiae CBS 107.79]
MDERESSTASSVDFYGSEEKPSTPQVEVQEDAVPSKRKAEEPAQPQQKKQRLDSPARTLRTLEPCAGLPPAVWQHVFLCCSLPDLGRLLQVNRSFHSYLSDVQDVSFLDPASGSLRLFKSESIWAAARNALPVKSPKPLPGFSELQMWQLVWSKRCQFCQRLDSETTGEKIWQKGPGAHGVRTIWPLGIRACGSCLMEKCQTDASLLFSNASALRPALPHIFVTNDANYIPAYMLQAATTPAGVEIAKYYYKAHVEDISKELTEALTLGPAAAEEWSKGLEARGQERMKLAENWERWEVKYQWWSDHNTARPAASATPSPARTALNEPVRSPVQHAPSPVIHAPTPATPVHLYMHSRPPTVAQHHTPQPGGNMRGLHDANEAKANRKADIERRCQQMNPPIQANVLRHMDSFRAAIQISQPMSDYAWSVLQPRLVAQLPAAQQAEADHVSRASSLPKSLDRRLLDANSKESKEIMDREWDEAQRPIRDKLGAIADDFINNTWDCGRAVIYENSPKFAVDVLVHVRRIYYAESANESTTSGQGQHQSLTDSGLDPKKPKLVLDCMKWVYDNKIKNLTEQFRKELFLCYGAGCEGNTKLYGFEGIVQHYGAKHTNAFSVGNVIVAWREAEWPEETPFHPDPTSVKHAFHSAAGTGAHSGYGGYYGGYSRAGTSTPHMQTHLPQASPGPYQYGGHYAGPFAPPQMASSAMSGYEYNQPYGATLESYQYQSMAPPGYGAHPGNAYMTSPAVSNTAIAPPPAGPLPVLGMRDTSHRSDDASHRTSLFDKQVSTVIEMAQDIWKQTSGVKDLPNSLRIYVLLQRSISKFHIEFNYEPSLDHFLGAFSSLEIPRALKNAPGLSCKACQDEISRYSRPEERKTFTVLNLFEHFKSQHSGPQASGYGNGQLPGSLDWKEDMIELPSDRVISGLIHAPGMDDDKLHMVATVFPTLFPTPLPKIGRIDNGEATSPVRSLSKDIKVATNPSGTPGIPIEGSGPSSLASPYTGSSIPHKVMEEEYDPQRPALSSLARTSSRTNTRMISHRSTPPSEYRHRYYAEPRYHVGQPQKPSVALTAANHDLPQQPVDAGREEFEAAQEYVEFASEPRQYREAGPTYDDFPERRPLYRGEEAYFRSTREEVLFAQPRAGCYETGYRPVSRHARYVEDDLGHPGHHLREQSGSIGPSPVNEKSTTDRFLDEFVPIQPSNGLVGQRAPRLEIDQAPEDGSRYTPPPPSFVVPDGLPGPRHANVPPHRTASAASNGSRYGEHRPPSRQIPTPENARGPRRPGPQRRRDRYQDHVPSRYYRYMGASREEPYSRGASMSRSQSKRYEEQRRRIDQQETPQPGAEQDPTYSRDQSVERAPADETPYQSQRGPQEYVSVQDRSHPYSPRYRYADEHHGPPRVYVEEYGHPLDEYEVVHVPRGARRAPYASHSQGRYVEYEPERVQYVPVSYDRPLPRQHEGGYERIYYEGRERQPPPRRPIYEAEAAYEQPPPDAPVPQVKVENPQPAPGL